MSAEEKRAIISALESELEKAGASGHWPGELPDHKWKIISSVSLWLETGIHAFMDHAVETAIRLNAPFTDSLRVEMLAVLYQRRAGRDKGTWKQVQRYFQKQRAFTLIANLRYHGAGLSEAAQKAAMWLENESEGRFSLKASSAERQYQAEWVKTGLEREHFEAWERQGKPRQHVGWAAVRANLPVMPDIVARLGVRR